MAFVKYHTPGGNSGNADYSTVTGDLTSTVPTGNLLVFISVWHCGSTTTPTLQEVTNGTVSATVVLDDARCLTPGADSGTAIGLSYVVSDGSVFFDSGQSWLSRVQGLPGPGNHHIHIWEFDEGTEIVNFGWVNGDTNPPNGPADDGESYIQFASIEGKNEASRPVGTFTEPVFQTGSGSPSNWVTDGGYVLIGSFSSDGQGFTSWNGKDETSVIVYGTIRDVVTGPPADPTGLAVDATRATEVDLSWTDNATSETGYRVEWAEDSGFTTNLQSTTLPAGSTSHTVTGLTSGTTYWFRVYAVNASGDSGPSNSVSTTTLIPSVPFSGTVAGTSGASGSTVTTLPFTGTVAATSGASGAASATLLLSGQVDGVSTMQGGITAFLLPLAPTNLVVTDVRSTEVDLSWLDNSDNETGFRVEWGVMGTVLVEQIGTYPLAFREDGVGATSETFTNFPLGEPDPYRHIILVVEGTYSADTWSGSLAGVPLTNLTAGLPWYPEAAGILMAKVPGGTTGDLVLNNPNDWLNISIGAFRVTGAEVLGLDDVQQGYQGNGLSGLEATLVCEPDGVVIGAAGQQGKDSGARFDWDSPAVEQWDVGHGFNAGAKGAALITAPDASQTIRYTTTYGTGRHVLNAVSVSPRIFASTALNLGALSVMDGFTDAITGQPYTVNGTVTDAGTDLYGHAACESADSGCLALSLDFTSNRRTWFGATNLVNASNSQYATLVLGGEGGIQRQWADTNVATSRHAITPDVGTWHFFVFTIDDTTGTEVSNLYIDGVLTADSPITRNDSANYNAGLEDYLFGGKLGGNRQIGQFSACGVIDGVLTPAEVAELYAAYQNGP